MFKQACPGVPVAAIVKVDGGALRLRRLRSNGYVFSVSDWCCSREDIPSICLCSVSVFRRHTRYRFKVINFQSSLKQSENQFLEKSRSLTKKTSKFRKDSYGHWFTYSCQVSRKSVKRKWPNGCAVFITKKVAILPFVWGFWIDLAKNCTGSPFLRCPCLCQVLCNFVLFSKRYIQQLFRSMPQSSVHRSWVPDREISSVLNPV